MTRLLTLDDATEYRLTCRIPTWGRRHLRIYQSADLRGRTRWLARGVDTGNTIRDVILADDGQGTRRWRTAFQSGPMAKFKTAQEAFDAAIAAGADIDETTS